MEEGLGPVTRAYESAVDLGAVAAGKDKREEGERAHRDRQGLHA